MEDNADYKFVDLYTGTSKNTGSFTGGGAQWVTAGYEVDAAGSYHLTLTGIEGGDFRDLHFFDPESVLQGAGTGEFLTSDNTSFTSAGANWTEVYDASGANWAGANILTQSNAQEALAQLDEAITNKDVIRANLGALQNRLENTITNLSIQAENLQAAESRISDVDVATEMTEFTRNNIMAQAATSMLAQANSLAQLALSLLG